MIMTGIFILWSCTQNTVGIRVSFLEWIGWLLMAADFVLEEGFAWPAVFLIWLWSEYDRVLNIKAYLKMLFALQVKIPTGIWLTSETRTSETRRWNRRLALRAPSLNKTRDTKYAISVGTQTRSFSVRLLPVESPHTVFLHHHK